MEREGDEAGALLLVGVRSAQRSKRLTYSFQLAGVLLLAGVLSPEIAAPDVTAGWSEEVHQEAARQCTNSVKIDKSSPPSATSLLDVQAVCMTAKPALPRLLPRWVVHNGKRNTCGRTASRFYVVWPACALLRAARLQQRTSCRGWCANGGPFATGRPRGAQPQTATLRPTAAVAAAAAGPQQEDEAPPQYLVPTQVQRARHPARVLRH